MEQIIITVLYVCMTYFSSTHQNLQAGEKNVCRSHTNPMALHCCYNYFEINGSCQECKNGTKSRDGKVCKQCKKGWFGYRCLLKCHCSMGDRCDHVVGCIISVVFLTDGTTDSRNVQTNVIKRTRENMKDSFDTTTQNKEHISNTDFPFSITSYTGYSINVFFYYIIAIGVIIAVLLACIAVVLIFKCIRKSSFAPRHQTLSVISSNQVSDQIYQGIYDEIADVPELPTDRNSYLSLQSEKINSDTNNSSPSVNSGRSSNDHQQICSEIFDSDYSLCLAISEDVIISCDKTVEFDKSIQTVECVVADGNDEDNADYITPIA